MRIVDSSESANWLVFTPITGFALASLLAFEEDELFEAFDMKGLPTRD